MHLISEMPEPAAYGAKDLTRIALVYANSIYKTSAQLAFPKQITHVRIARPMAAHKSEVESLFTSKARKGQKPTENKM